MANRMWGVAALVLGVWCGGAAGQDVTKPIVDKAAQALGGADKQKLAGITFDTSAKIPAGAMDVELTGSWSVQGFDKVNASLTANVNGLQKNVVMIMKGAQVWGQEMNGK